MPKVKLPDNTKTEDAGFNQAPKGVYTAKIAEFNVGETGSDSKVPGQPMGIIVFELVKDGKGKKIKKGTFANVWHRIPLDDQNDGWTRRLKEFRLAFGLPLKKSTLDTDALVGESCQVSLREGKDQDDEYRPDVSKLMKLADTSVDWEEMMRGDDDEDVYSEEDLNDMDLDELKEALEEVEGEVAGKKTKKKLIAAILEAQGEDEDEDDGDDDDDDDDEEEYSEEDLLAMDTAELKELAETNDIEVPGKKTKKKLVAALLAAQEDGDEDGEDDDDDDDDSEDGYDDMSKTELVKEVRSRGGKVKSSMKTDDLIEWLRENDEEDEDNDDDDDDDELDPDEMDAKELKAALKERGLKTGGSEKVLRTRLTKALEEDDDGDPF